MTDLSRYVGVPYRELGRDLSGCDCWGLIRCIYRDVKGVDLPSYDGRYAGRADREAIKRLVDTDREDWQEVCSGSEQVLDAVLFRGDPYHIGVVASPGRVLHIQRDCDSVIASYRMPPMRNRLLGFYRYCE